MEEGERISIINDAGLQIQRLHNIWNEVRHARETGNLEKAKDKLDSAEVELHVDTKGDKIKDINKNIALHYRKFTKDSRMKLYKLLINKEKLLREIQDGAGKGGKYRDEDEDDF